MKSYYKLALCLSLFVLPAFGCAFGTDYVKINKYAPAASADKPGGGIEVYVAKVEDNRSQPEYLGQKAGGYIALEKGLNLSQVLTDSMVSCLECAGYTVKYSENPGAEGQPVRVLHASVEELWTTFVQGFWTVDANARAKMDFELREPGSGRVLWRKTIGKGATESAIAAPPGLFEDSLNNSLAEVMKQFQAEITSDDFKNALVKGTVSLAQ